MIPKSKLNDKQTHNNAKKTKTWRVKTSTQADTYKLTEQENELLQQIKPKQIHKQIVIILSITSKPKQITNTTL